MPEAVRNDCGAGKERLVLVGDMNAKDDETATSCKTLGLQEARYAGASWGVKHNDFYADTGYKGP